MNAETSLASTRDLGLQLSDDILLKIFHDCFTNQIRSTHFVSRHDDHVLLAFSQTCRAWRDLALLTPSLWNAVPMHLSRLASLLTQRVGSAPIDIIWDLSAGTASLSRHTVGWREILQSPPPIRSIRVVCIPSTAYLLPDIIKVCVERSPSTPQLLDLRLNGARGCRSISIASALFRHIYLENYFPSVQSMSDSLTTLIIKRRLAWKGIEPIEVFRLLEHAPYLELVVLHSVLGEMDYELESKSSYPNQPVALPTLQSLEIHDRFSSIIRAFGCLHMPRLQRMIISDMHFMDLGKRSRTTDSAAMKGLYDALAQPAFASAVALPDCSISVQVNGEVRITRQTSTTSHGPGLSLTISRPSDDLLSELLQIIDSEAHSMQLVTDFDFGVVGHGNIEKLSKETGMNMYILGSDCLSAVLQGMPNLRSLSIRKDAALLGLLALYNFPDFCPALAELTLHHAYIRNTAKASQNGEYVRARRPLAAVAASRPTLERITFVYCLLDGRNLRADDYARAFARLMCAENEADNPPSLTFLQEIVVIDHVRTAWKRKASTSNEASQ